MSNPATILVVEDDAFIRDMYATALESAGFNVIQADNGRSGVEQALAHHPACILIDIMMPVMNGHEAVNKIRHDPWGKNAKIIYLTNMDDAENIFTAVEQKTEKYIIKANTPIKEVINTVRTIAHS